MYVSATQIVLVCPTFDVRTKKGQGKKYENSCAPTFELLTATGFIWIERKQAEELSCAAQPWLNLRKAQGAGLAEHSDQYTTW